MTESDRKTFCCCLEKFGLEFNCWIGSGCCIRKTKSHTQIKSDQEPEDEEKKIETVNMEFFLGFK